MDNLLIPHHHTPDHQRPRPYRHWPLLLLAALSYAGCVWMLTSVYPDQVQDWGRIPGGYLPLLGLGWFGHFFLMSFLWQHSRRGLVSATALTLLSLLFLNGLFSWQTVFPLVILAGTYEVGARWLQRRLV